MEMHVLTKFRSHYNNLTTPTSVVNLEEVRNELVHVIYSCSLDESFTTDWRTGLDGTEPPCD